MKYMLDLSERIYDKDLGEGISSTELIFEKYYKSKDADDYFISFTEIEKLGINPKSGYNTPLGIYTYPVKEFFLKYVNFTSQQGLGDKDRRIGVYAPFAGSSPWVWVVKVNRGVGNFIDDIDSMSDKDFYKYEKIFIDMIYNTIVDDNKKGTVGNGRIWDYLNQKKLYTIDQVKNKDERSMKIIISEILSQWGDESNYQSLGGRFWNMSRLVANENPVKWNKLFRDLGITGVADRSDVGIIHSQESTQSVFFSIKAFKIIEKVQNIEAAGGMDIEITNSIVKVVVDIQNIKYNILPFYQNNITGYFKELRRIFNTGQVVNNSDLGEIFRLCFESIYDEVVNRVDRLGFEGFTNFMRDAVYTMSQNGRLKFIVQAFENQFGVK